jgi:hypothetical protein
LDNLTSPTVAIPARFLYTVADGDIDFPQLPTESK